VGVRLHKVRKKMIVIPKRLRLLVEEYIKASDRSREVGGFFFGSEGKFKAFLPCPNFSQTPHREFKYGSGRHFAEEFSKLIGLPVVADMHTHPDGTVISSQDLVYLKSGYSYHVVIADMGEAFRWFVLDRRGREVGVVESDEELERLAFFFAKETGLTDLGRAFLTPSGELLITTDKGRCFLQLDTDALKVYQALSNYKPRWKRPSKKELRELTGLSSTRLNRALNKLKETSVGKVVEGD